MTGKILFIEERHLVGQDLVGFMWPRIIPAIQLGIFFGPFRISNFDLLLFLILNITVYVSSLRGGRAKMNVPYFLCTSSSCATFSGRE